MQRRAFIAASLGSVAAVQGCMPAAPGRGQLLRMSALGFGTTISIAVVHPDRALAMQAIEEAFEQARLVEQLMSIYSPGSQVYQLNRDGILRRPHPHLLAVLEQARQLSIMSRGAFDITVQPLWRVYRDATTPNGRPPQSERLKAASKVNWERVEFDSHQVSLRKPGMQVTLNGLAQGYAADLALKALRRRGIAHALVDTGEFRGTGRKSAQAPWVIGIADPRQPTLLAGTLEVEGRSVATSGDYASTFTQDFVHHHIFDPATGDSPQELASVTVLAPSGILADGLSTACMVMGARKAHALAATLPQVDLMTINKRGVVWKSAGFPRPAA